MKCDILLSRQVLRATASNLPRPLAIDREFSLVTGGYQRVTDHRLGVDDRRIKIK